MNIQWGTSWGNGERLQTEQLVGVSDFKEGINYLLRTFQHIKPDQHNIKSLLINLVN